MSDFADGSNAATSSIIVGAYFCANSYAPAAIETVPNAFSQCSSDSGFSGATAPFTITSDSRGIAASNPLPLGRYFVREIKAPRFYQLNTQKVEVKLKVEGDVVRIEMYNDAASIKTSIKKTGNYTVDAGDNMRYDITNVANQSNVPLDNFFWHDRIPTDAVRVGTITTGT